MKSILFRLALSALAGFAGYIVAAVFLAGPNGNWPPFVIGTGIAIFLAVLSPWFGGEKAK